MNLSDIFQIYKNGQLDSALRHAESYVAKNSSNPDAHHLLGVLLANKKEYLPAQKALKKAHLLAPKNGEILLNLGNCQKEWGHLDDAIQAYKNSILLNRHEPSAHNNLGNCYEMQGNYALAINSYKNAVNCDPKYINAILNLSHTLFKTSEYKQALEHLDHALTIDSASLEALNARGLCYVALNELENAELDFLKAIKLQPKVHIAYLHLGNVRLSQKRYSEAIELYTKCIDADKNNFDALSNIAVALNGLKDYPKALDYLNNAIEICPKNPLLLTNRGVILRKLRRIDEAIIDLISAIELNPQYLEAYVNLGSALLSTGKDGEAKVIFNHALTIDANCTAAHYNLGLIDLKNGELKKGWVGYGYRWKINDFPSSPLKTNLPTWTPTDHQKRLLIWGEQGIGDEIMFSRQFNLAPQLSKKICVYTNQKLIPVFARSYPEIKFIPYGVDIKEQEYDCHMPIGSLGLHLNSDMTSLSLIPTKTLTADLELTKKIRAKYVSPNKLICGISWKSMNIDLGKERSVDLQALASVLDTPGLTLINLQYGSVTQELEVLNNLTGIKIHQEQELDIFNNLDHLASMIEACDLIISIDNSTIHMAGALGKKTWVLLPKNADWRWCVDTNESYWYSSIELFRQSHQGKWDDVLLMIRQRIANLQID